MGVLNLTPDSFYDGGRYLDVDAARARAEELVSAGADILDLGAESSRPGAADVGDEEQLARLAPALEAALSLEAVVSVDTTSPGVAKAVLARGAQLINDVSCLREPDLARVVAEHDAWLALTHVRGPMSTMSGFSAWPDDDYPDIVEDVSREWDLARQKAMTLGVKAHQIIFDPGLGFSKNARHSYALLRHLRSFRRLGVPILVGPGRKSFISAVDTSAPEERLGGTIAASLAASLQGADALRVHDVFEVRQALRVLAAVRHPEFVPLPEGS
jgi:dihydropteroate synthase